MFKLSNFIGKTPLIPLSVGKYTVWGKAELMNPGGSVKDRMASFIINDAEKKQLIKKGDTLYFSDTGRQVIWGNVITFA